MLHSFWYPVAEKAFTEITQREPTCGMAYWGVAMSRFHPLWSKLSPADVEAGQAALEKARTMVKTDRELAYVNALTEIYRNADKVDHLTRLQAYEKAMDGLQRRYSDDSEAAIFYALSLLGTAYWSPADKTYLRQQKAGGILEKIFVQQPDHPGVAHYIIHSYDYLPLAEQARSQRAYAKIAPDAPHALHMPSHIFTRRGLWEESIRRIRHRPRRPISTVAGQELHAMDYLTYAYLQGSQDEEARKMLERVSILRSGIDGDFAGLYGAAAIPARYAVERRQWKEAAALTVPEGVFPGGASCWAEATLYFARGVGAARTGDAAGAREAIGQLERCREALAKANDKLWGAQVDVQRSALAAWLALAEGKKDEALAQMRAAADLEDSTDKSPTTPGAVVPARELLGEMLLELKRPAEAEAEFEATLRSSPNRFRSLYGAGRAAELVGNQRKAAEYYDKLVDVCPAYDTDRAELQEARAFLRRVNAIE
jgi:tetratricopeptide (TPR) repeat protein